MQFPETSIENLRGLGYTEDESQFLYIVATHSGYFSARQYLAFTGAKSGEKSMAFTQKLLGKGHASARLLLRNGRVYHLYALLTLLRRLAAIRRGFGRAGSEIGGGEGTAKESAPVDSVNNEEAWSSHTARNG